MPAVRRLLLPGLALCLFAAACGGPPAPVAPEAPPGYRQLRETFGPRDFGPLQGRRIVLDPGHGGAFRGARGPGGLDEADVNLGVALYLRGLLEWAGARVWLTRTADYDLLALPDSTLASELGFRVSFTDSIQPDVFVSIHHNSTASADPTVNETQTYYPLGDDGASLDLAQAIHRHLVRNLEIRPARILPGNFRVLREATVPAVLGEPAMISHPVMEGRLAQAAAQRLEAEAYFLGLLDYFAGGDPRWIPAQADTVAVPAGGMALAWTLADPRPGAPGPDPTTFAVTVDGCPVEGALSADGATLRWYCPATADAGTRRVEVHGRNLAGRRARDAVTVIRPAVAVELRVDVLADPAGAAPRRAHLAVTPTGGGVLPAGTIGWPGVADGVLDVPAAAALAAGVVARGAGAPVFIPAGPTSVTLSVHDDILPDPLRLVPVAGGGAAWQDRLAARRPLAGGMVVDPAVPAWGEARGHRPVLIATGDLAPVAASAVLPELAGLVIVIDPAGGGADADGEGPTGLRGADLNLAVARRLADLVEGCGARAVLSRDEGDVPTPTAKVALADAVRADLFLTVGRSPDGTVQVAHHPGSTGGQAWAAAGREPLGRLLPAATMAVGPSWGYLLRHTACPALEIRLPGPATDADEQRLEQPAWAAAEARALLLALAGQRTGGAAPWADPLAVLAGLPEAPQQVRWARWDGNLALLPLPTASGPGGAASVSLWGEPGMPAAGPDHTLEVHGPAGWQLWALTRGEDGAWTGRLVHRADAATPASE